MRFKEKMTTAAAVLVCTLACFDASSQTMEVAFRTLGIKINVTDMNKAVDFYGNSLGFQVDSRALYPQEVLLKSADRQPVLLNLVHNILPETANESRAGFTLQVNDLDSAIQKMKAKGVDFKDSQKRKEGVGYAMTIYDPFGCPISMMHQTIVKTPHFTEPQIYNYGFLIPDMNAAREFYTKNFGFVVRSEKYLPNDLPLGHQDQSFGFMLHFRQGVEAVRHNSSHSEHTVIMFQTKNLDAAVKALRQSGVRILQKEPQTSALGKYMSFYDPFGYVSELVERK